MNTLSLQLLDGSSEIRLEGIASLVAEDVSGQFGLLPGHEALVTLLRPGLIRCRLLAGGQRFLASAGGPLVCRANQVRIVSPRFLCAERADQLSAQLDQLQSREHGTEVAEHQSREQLERALVRRLREWSEASRS